METKFITEDDRGVIRGFAKHHIAQFRSAVVPRLYHYTRGSTLIDIIKSGRLWSTQIGCLNDESEVLFGLGELRTKIEAARKAGTYARSDLILRCLLDATETPHPEGLGWFVACFSEDADDLSQWRAYSDGEGGYALEFDPIALDSEADQHTFLAKVEYDPTRHSVFFDDVIDWVDQLYTRGITEKRGPTAQEWAEDLCQYLLRELGLFAALVKHEKFKGEREWRLLHFFQETDRPKMQFVSRRSFISRHIPLLCGGTELAPRLPLTGVVVGPCRYKGAAKLAAGDLLAANGYSETSVPVRHTVIPYRHV